MKEFFDFYMRGGCYGISTVIALYILFVGIILTRYLTGVYSGKWELDKCTQVAMNMFKGLFFGFLFGIFCAIVSFLAWPIILIIMFVSSLHPDFRKRVGEQFINMNKKSALRYIFFAFPIVLFVIFIELVNCADEVLDEDLD